MEDGKDKYLERKKDLIFIFARGMCWINNLLIIGLTNFNVIYLRAYSRRLIMV
ncbi:MULTISPECIES: hypothetical protein [Okeania]|uniref:hypothetical protein n=1 Tax=Okeania TaxID=1458928 RepID=UPI0013752C74|nr:MULTISPECIES: hypothetical protein [unclassified Okeania]NES75585.1 hypothetical protein [Okeania sp. SIO1H4]NET18014.1 hypothetical protein [Okeania sp. SIO1H5]NET93016.1 hypothetical protein [Okeania sp. SIO1H2]